MTTALDRWRAGGTKASDFTPVEAGALADFLMQRGWSIYTDRKHVDHAALCAQVAELRQRDAPGFIGAGGEVCDGQAPGGNLFGGA